MATLPPPKPTIFIRPDALEGQLLYFWDAPAASSFTLDISGVGAPGPVTLGSNVNAYTATGLTNGELYEAKLYNNDGQGTSAPAVFRTVQPGLVPSILQAADVRKLNETHITFTWEEPTGDGGATIQWYVMADDVSGAKWNTVGSKRTLTVPMSPGATKLSVHAVNDPGYSTPFTVYVNKTAVLMTFNDSGVSPNYLYMVYDITRNNWSPIIDSGLSTANHGRYGDDYNAGGTGYFYTRFYTYDPEEDGHNKHKFQCVGIEGVVRNTLVILSDQDNGYYINKDIWLLYNARPIIPYDYTYDVQLYYPLKNVLQRAVVSVPISMYINDALSYGDGYFFSTYNPGDGHRFLYYWNYTMTAPASLGDGYGLHYNNNSFATYQFVAVENGTYVDRIEYMGQGGVHSTIAVAPSTYVTINQDDFYGINKQHYFFLFALAGSYTVDIWSFTPSNSLTPVVLSNVGTGYYGTRYFYSYANDYFNGQNNHLSFYDLNEFAVSTAGTVYTLFGGASEFVSTIFTSSNPMIMGYYPGAFSGMNSDGLITVEQVDLSLNVRIVKPDGSDTSVPFATATDLADFGYLNTLNGAAYFQATYIPGGYMTPIFNTSTATVVSTPIDTLYGLGSYYSGSNMMFRGSADSNLSFYTGLDQSFTTNTDTFFSGSYDSGVGTGFVDDVSGGILWAYSINGDTISTCCLQDGQLPVYNGISCTVSYDNGTYYDVVLGRFFLAKDWYSTEPVFITVWNPDGTVSNFDGNAFGNYAYIHDTPHTTNHTIHFKIWSDDLSTWCFVNYDIAANKFYSSIMDNTSTLNDIRTNYYNDYYDW